MAKPKGVLDFLFDEFRAGVRDIRQKAVEQGWFGQVATAKPVEVHAHMTEPRATTELRPEASEAELPRRPSFEEQWAPHEQASEPIPERDHEIER
jgi:hypothetical protein